MPGVDECKRDEPDEQLELIKAKGMEHENAFLETKKALTSPLIGHYYDPALKSELLTIERHESRIARLEQLAFWQVDWGVARLR